MIAHIASTTLQFPTSKPRYTIACNGRGELLVIDNTCNAVVYATLDAGFARTVRAAMEMNQLSR